MDRRLYNRTMDPLEPVEVPHSPTCGIVKTFTHPFGAYMFYRATSLYCIVFSQMLTPSTPSRAWNVPNHIHIVTPDG